MEDIKKRLLEIEDEIELKEDREVEKGLFNIGDVAFLEDKLTRIWNELIKIYWDIVKKGRKDRIKDFYVIKEELDNMKDMVRFTSLWERWKKTYELVEEIESKIR